MCYCSSDFHLCSTGCPSPTNSSNPQGVQYVHELDLKQNRYLLEGWCWYKWRRLHCDIYVRSSTLLTMKYKSSFELSIEASEQDWFNLIIIQANFTYLPAGISFHGGKGSNIWNSSCFSSSGVRRYHITFSYEANSIRDAQIQCSWIPPEYWEIPTDSIQFRILARILNWCELLSFSKELSVGSHVVLGSDKNSSLELRDSIPD